MSAALGLARPPRTLTASLDRAATNLADAATELGRFLDGAPDAAAALEARAAAAQRLRDEVRLTSQSTRLIGSDRLQAAALGHGVCLVVERLRDVGATWSACPLTEASDAVAALRDCARASARAVAVHHDPDAVLERIDRCEAQEHELRACVRRARALLVAEGSDARVALSAERLLGSVERGLRVGVELRLSLQRYALS